MAQCACGYTHSHIEHICSTPPVLQGTRVPVSARCKCGFLHSHIQHDCATFPPLPKPPAPCEVCGPGGTDTSKPCSVECFVAAGYPAEEYQPRFGSKETNFISAIVEAVKTAHDSPTE